MSLLHIFIISYVFIVVLCGISFLLTEVLLPGIEKYAEKQRFYANLRLVLVYSALREVGYDFDALSQTFAGISTSLMDIGYIKPQLLKFKQDESVYQAYLMVARFLVRDAEIPKRLPKAIRNDLQGISLEKAENFIRAFSQVGWDGDSESFKGAIKQMEVKQ